MPQPTCRLKHVSHEQLILGMDVPDVNPPSPEKTDHWYANSKQVPYIHELATHSAAKATCGETAMLVLLLLVSVSTASCMLKHPGTKVGDLSTHPAPTEINPLAPES